MYVLHAIRRILIISQGITEAEMLSNILKMNLIHKLPYVIASNRFHCCDEED